MDDTALEQLPETFREAVRDYEDVHTTLGIVGNVSFFVGSIFFLFESLKTAGVWLFILGSLGMMIGSIGQAIVRHERRKRDEQRDDERRRITELVRRLEGRPRQGPRPAREGGRRRSASARPRSEGG